MKNSQNSFNVDGSVSNIIALRVKLNSFGEGKLGEMVIKNFQKVHKLNVHDFVLGYNFYRFNDHLNLSFLHVLVVFQH